MQTNFLLMVTAMSALFSGCVKTASEDVDSTTLNTVSQAQAFFEKNIVSLGKTPNPNNFRARQSKSILWDQAIVKHYSNSNAVIVPVAYKNKLFVSLKSAPDRAFNLNDLTALAIIPDSNKTLHATMITFIPDSNSNNSTPSGIYLIEDWQGNSLYRPMQVGPAMPKSKETEIAKSIQVCNVIDGYNYSPDDPDNGFAWSETSCNTYEFAPESAGPGPGSNLIKLAPIRFPIPLAIIVSPPGNPINSIADYFKCFTNGSSADHSYTVQVCVDQPYPGSRQCWGFTPGGPIGSSSAGNAVNTGHSFLVLTENDQGTTISRNVGFYPSSIVVSSNTFCQGALNNDQSHSYDISLTINVTGSQFFNVLNYVSLGNNQGYDYNLGSNNCTTFVINALSTGGITLPSTVGTWPGGAGNDPGDLGEDIRNMSLSTNMTRNTVENDHPNIGNCN